MRILALPRNSLLFLFIFLILAPAAGASSVEPELVANINRQPEGRVGSVCGLLDALPQGRVLFLAQLKGLRCEPWVSDGTAEGTQRLLLSEPSAARRSPLFLPWSTPVGDRLLLVEGGGELWGSDGTVEGTRPLGIRSNVLGDDVTPAQPVLPLEDDMAFLHGAEVGSSEGRFAVTDGTREGTRSWPAPGYVTLHGVVGGQVIFSTSSGETWRSDGTEAGTEAFRASLPEREFRLAAFNAEEAFLLYQVGGHDPESGETEPEETSIWRTDGTDAGTLRLGTVPGSTYGFFDAVAGGRLWFRVSEAGESQLYALDPAGDLSGPVVLPGSVRGLQAVGGEVFIHSVRDIPRVAHLPSPGTIEVRPLQQSAPVLSANGFLPYGSGLVWLDSVGVRYAEAGDMAARTLFPISQLGLSGPVIRVVPLGGEDRVLVASGYPGGLRLAIGPPGVPNQPASPTLLLELDPVPDVHTAAPGERFVSLGDEIFFAPDDPDLGREPWVTDGTPEGTDMVSDLRTPSGDLGSDPAVFLQDGAKTFFFASDATGRGLWTSDATTPGTRLVRRLEDELFGRIPLTAGTSADRVGDRVLFRTRDWDIAVIDSRSGGLEILDFEDKIGIIQETFESGLLWRFLDGSGYIFTDGTDAGTRLLKERPLDEVTQLGAGYLSVGEAIDPASGRPAYGLWRLDGEFAVVGLVFEDDAEGRLLHLVSNGAGTAFFVRLTADGATSEIWRSDGTATGTRRLASHERCQLLALTPVGDRLFYVRDYRQLWLADASTGAHRELTEGLLGAGDMRPLLPFLRPLRGGVLFVGEQELFGEEVYFTDGTLAGTRVLDLEPGPAGSSPTIPWVQGDRAFFAIRDGDRTVFQVTDGRLAGTYPILDFSDPDLHGPLGLVLLGNRFLFPATRLDIGTELWTAPLEGPPGGLPRDVPPPSPPRDFTVAGGELLGEARAAWEVSLEGEDVGYFLEARRWDEPDFRIVETFGVASESPFKSDVEYLFDLPVDVPHLFRVTAINAHGLSHPSPVIPFTLRGHRSTCRPAEQLCLAGGEFSLRVFWRDQRSGDSGVGTANLLPGGQRSGTFWFFREENVEILAKVLDGRAMNDHFWLFAGGLTDVEYWLVAEDERRRRTYHHPPGSVCGFADTNAFEWPPGTSPSTPSTASGVAATPAEAKAGPPALHLLGDRYRVTVSWRDQRTGNTGAGTAVPGSDNTGYFWLFRPENIELVIKVLDGEPVNGHHWVFYGGITDLEYDLLVEDLASGESRRYHHSPGDLCGGADTTAFDATE